MRALDSLESLSQDSQVIFCQTCGAANSVPILKGIHAKKGTGSSYTIKNLHEDHEFSMRALFELDAVDLYKRKPLKAIARKFKDLANRYPTRMTVGGRLSELANSQLEFVGWYSPKKTEKKDDNPTFRGSNLAGWFLRQRGLEWCWHRLGYVDGEFIALTTSENLSDWTIGKVVWENDHKADRLIPIPKTH